jgi:hypothetical protein
MNVNIDRVRIRAALRGFLEMLENVDNPESVEMLEMWLGELAFLQHFVGEVKGEDNKYLGPPVQDQARWQKLIGEQFPALGHYNVPMTNAAQTISSGLLTRDAATDLADIASEISECLHRWENVGENHALWYLQCSYQEHWETHLRNLQIYLHDLH